jgi:hypothetical protein
MSNRSRPLTETNTPSALSWSVAGAACSPPPPHERGGKGRGDAGQGRRGGDEAGQRQGRAGRGQQKHAPGVLLLTAHGQEGVPLDRDSSGMQRLGKWVSGVSRDVICGQGDGQRPMCRPRVYCVAYHATPSGALHRRTPSFCPFRWREPLRPLTAWSARAPVRHSYWKTGRGASSVRLASVCVPRRRGIDGASSSAALTLAKPSSWLARKSPGVLDEERGRREY